jgi:hypothetical protein
VRVDHHHHHRNYDHHNGGVRIDGADDDRDNGSGRAADHDRVAGADVECADHLHITADGHHDRSADGHHDDSSDRDHGRFDRHGRPVHATEQEPGDATAEAARGSRDRPGRAAGGGTVGTGGGASGEGGSGSGPFGDVPRGGSGHLQQ